jgi:hypothetical protein
MNHSITTTLVEGVDILVTLTDESSFHWKLNSSLDPIDAEALARRLKWSTKLQALALIADQNATQRHDLSQRQRLGQDYAQRGYR